METDDRCYSSNTLTIETVILYTGTGETIPGQKTIDTFNPSSKEDFTELSNMISTKLTQYEVNTPYTILLYSESDICRYFQCTKSVSCQIFSSFHS